MNGDESRLGHYRIRDLWWDLVRDFWLDDRKAIQKFINIIRGNPKLMTQIASIWLARAVFNPGFSSEKYNTYDLVVGHSAGFESDDDSHGLLTQLLAISARNSAQPSLILSDISNPILRQTHGFPKAQHPDLKAFLTTSTSPEKVPQTITLHIHKVFRCAMYQRLEDNFDFFIARAGDISLKMMVVHQRGDFWHVWGEWEDQTYDARGFGQISRGEATRFVREHTEAAVVVRELMDVLWTLPFPAVVNTREGIEEYDGIPGDSENDENETSSGTGSESQETEDEGTDDDVVMGKYD